MPKCLLGFVKFTFLSLLWLALADTIVFFSGSYGHINMYDKSYDRINTRNEKLLQHIDRVKYDTTTSDDPIMQQVKNVWQFGILSFQEFQNPSVPL